MAGNSSRFFSAGYVKPKYMLPYRGKTIFHACVAPFASVFRDARFIFVIRSDFVDEDWISDKLAQLSVTNFSIKSVPDVTSGQAQTVAIGLGAENPLDQIIVFNIDTILTEKSLANLELHGDGFLQTFSAEGDNWSFVDGDTVGNVSHVAEKKRISDHCSTGLYYFKSVDLYNKYFKQHEASSETELFVAPIYNFMINDGLTIRYGGISPTDILLAGTPEDYEKLT